MVSNLSVPNALRYADAPRTGVMHIFESGLIVVPKPETQLREPEVARRPRDLFFSARPPAGARRHFGTEQRKEMPVENISNGTSRDSLRDEKQGQGYSVEF